MSPAVETLAALLALAACIGWLALATFREARVTRRPDPSRAARMAAAADAYDRATRAAAHRARTRTR